ncbi:serine hydrolase domain-containing protein [Phenylobacterium sp.]|jgi:CubicO group peptidase (beta-lactamase class C family)|uniref:serine hydrolase domain-containing protein n=1 Tax=Phenylobacterium sp. TaxID=1871053 RepID=UPI002E34135E|nr:serine hydrolase domain-containing protein [Phenylobacterium sp.]HEX4709970.1 serine hydrolase domain-containing protein [Phenylobacterium sp.]
MNPLSKIAALGAMFVALGGFASSPANPSATALAPGPVVSVPTPGSQAADNAATPPPMTGHALTAEDVAAYFDGLLPDAINRANIAGAVIVVVKDGQPLFERGYGLSDVKARKPVDPDKTLFRPGSISKTFTWTAVMQQVEAGKIDLDADVNQYLDFKIPPYDGKPVTMRNLLTHSAGFSDAAKDLIFTDPKRLKSLGATLNGVTPARIFPPGTTPAYSNYGAALAGYIVERVSGEPFTDYVAHHILSPLGMSHSTFAQPLPDGWSANMSKGYHLASSPPGAYEIVGPSPAGSMATTGSDMAHFMIAQLQDGDYRGQRILAAKTAETMHSQQFTPVPSLPGMAFGFYQEPGNGHRVIGHAGDTTLFHSDMHLFLDDHVGLFISLNSAGSLGAAHTIRATVFKGFTDRYFPAAPAPERPTWKDAKADGQTLAGRYVNSRRSDSGWLRIGGFLLGQAKVTATPNGVVTVSAFRGVNSLPKHWREIGPFQYQEVGGDSRMAAVVEGGKVTRIMTDDEPPVLSLEPVSGAMSATWNLPLFYLTIAILTIAAVSWPAAAIIRKHYGHSFGLTGRAALLYRLTRAVCLADLAFAGLWFWFMSHKGSAWLSSGNDGVVRLIQFVGLVGVVGAIAPLANVAGIFTDASRSWWAKVSSTAIAVACLASIWFAFSLHLITLRIAY